MVDKVKAGKYAVRDSIIFFAICVIASLIYCYFISTTPCTPELFIFILGALLTAIITFLKQLGDGNSGSNTPPKSGDGNSVKSSTTSLLSSLLCKLHFHF